MAKAKTKSKVAPEQKSIFDRVDTMVADFVIDNCKFDKSQKNWCKHWNGKGNIAEVKAGMECPVAEAKYAECKYFVKGKPCKNFRDKK